jgi:phospholipase C
VLHILTQKPDLWKKTIFVLTYDENDGYFDHVVPFTAPDPARAETGKTSKGVDAAIEYWSVERDLEKRSKTEARGSSIGLGFRVPMVIASPWSRGGYVCSQVFDHTSVLQLLENVLSHRSRKSVREPNISAWRRAVCGDLSSAFQPSNATLPDRLDSQPRDVVLASIHAAQFRSLPTGYRKLSPGDVEQVQQNASAVPWMPRQEPGTRPSLSLPYELYAGGALTAGGRSLEIAMEAGRRVFGPKSAGSPFHVYTPNLFRSRADLRTRAYAVEAGTRVTDTWTLDGFDRGVYHLCICGPNGFLRELKGSASDPFIDIRCEYPGKPPSGDLEVLVMNRGKTACQIHLKNHMYRGADQTTQVRSGQQTRLLLPLQNSFFWYDFTLTVTGSSLFLRRCAGRVETGRPGQSDPVMGRLS